jgi:DNA-binding response OmpR family regulator
MLAAAQSSAPLAYVLDDEPQVATLVSRALSAAGYAPQEFHTAAAFLDQITRELPELIVLDLELGESDAIALIRELAARQFRGRVLLISGRDASLLGEIEAIGRQHGLAMLPSLAKPFRLNQLKECVRATTVRS